MKLWRPQTTRDGLTRYGNVKEMRVVVSNKIWMESQQIVLPSHIFNMLKICRRMRQKIFAFCCRYWIRQWQLTATHDDWREIQNCNSQLNVRCRTPLFVIVWARLEPRVLARGVRQMYRFTDRYAQLLFTL